MISIHLLYEHDLVGNPHGCSHIRLLRPFSHPAIANQVKVTQGLELPQNSTDVVIVERSWRPGLTIEAAQNLVAEVRKRGALFVYTLDDNLLDLHEDAPWEIFPSYEQRIAFRYFAREADAIIVSTPNLKRRFDRLNTNTVVIPNALDERLFLPRRESGSERNHGSVRLGYMGTRTHASDLLMILPALRKFLSTHRDDVVLELVGVFSDSRLEQCFAGLPVRFLDVGEAVDYVQFIPWAQRNLHWDFAIAPLEDNAFNLCKSDIKFLDYAMLGIPGIFSAVSSYRNTVIHQNTGWLSDNSTEAWLEALERLFSDTDLRNAMRKNATAYATRQRTLKHCAVQWLTAVASIASHSHP